MLRHLQVRDFAIIESVEVEFNGGLTVLTGETGAGKSILVDALELLAGGRAGADAVRAGADKADITAIIDISGSGAALRGLLEEHSISHEDELILRRVIGGDGRSRAWLNGQMVPLQVLRQVAELLFDIHGQHEFQSLVRPATQRTLLDTYGQLESLTSQVRAEHSVWLALMNRSVELEAAASDRHSRLDLLRHHVQELDALQLRPGEVEALVEERSRILHHGRLVEAAGQALAALYEDEGSSAHSLIARSISALRVAGGLDARLEPLATLLDEAALRVKDASQALTQYLDTLEVDEERQDAIEKRLAAIEDVARKHRVPAAELPQRLSALIGDLSSLESSAADLATVRGQLTTALSRYQELARQLSSARGTAAKALAKDVSARMQELGMSGGRFVVEIAPLSGAEPSPHGIDQVEFRVTTNPGAPPRAVAKVASGGELARLSLAVQVACANTGTPCMVFDEVDAGIGGSVAEIVGRELRSLARSGQVLCVTHLPQVAAQGHRHLRVSKLSNGRSVRTSVTALEGDARVEEIARMLGGVEITPRARAHALDMLMRIEAAESTNTLERPQIDGELVASSGAAEVSLESTGRLPAAVRRRGSSARDQS
ncbi:MAG: DNA repair protein RecN [Gammaproteobacteria bacterium]|nr:DNA repair protein RecN [Gammaproteobacteria bacterium]